MPKLITDETLLRVHLPNIIATVKGETPFIERLAHFLDLAEEWVMQTFTGDEVFGTVCENSLSTLRNPLCDLVVAEAMRMAIPSLDIMLTPNGFAVVSTNSLAPASKPRVDRLTGSMLTRRDDSISALLRRLPTIEGWTRTVQAQFFFRTLFPDLSVVESIGNSTGSKWEKYLELRPLIMDSEASLAEEWFSEELMSALRSETLRGDLTGKRKDITLQIQAQIIALLKTGSFNTRRLADIVNCIRLNEECFREWHQSATARLFDPPVFSNEKNSSGYFF